jgi:integral membrane protein
MIADCHSSHSRLAPELLIRAPRFSAAEFCVSNSDDVARLRRLGILSVCEATTLLLLVGVAVPLKHIAGWTGAVHVMGPIHGLAFVAYCWTAIEAISDGGWTRGEAARLLLTAFVPFAGFGNVRLLERKAAALRGGAAR